MPSLRAALSGIGEPAAFPLALPSSFRGRTGPSLRTAMDGMTDPGMAQWHKVGVALRSGNNSLSEEAQGAATDGTFWYVCSNNLDGVVTFDTEAERVATTKPDDVTWERMWRDAGKPAPSTFNPHFGAPGYFDGWVYVPIQHPFGVWRFRPSGTQQAWQRAPEPPEDDGLFPWCAVHPFTEVLYTCSYGSPTHLYAYDRTTLARLDADIALGPAPLSVDHIQGGVFTAHGRFILVRSDYNAVFCYSGLNGHCFGAERLGDFGSIASEVESVTIRPWQFDQSYAPVHILELDNDWPTEDDFYLHSFEVPDPAKL